MKAGTARMAQRYRVAGQIAFTACFIALLLAAGDARLPSWAARGVFFLLDPLILLLHAAATRTVFVLGLLALIPVVLTLVLGRFFCGWVCPMGAIQRFFSWIFARSRPKVAGPARRLLRIKYLVLTAVLVSALLGANLGGWLDPFALLTRSVAAAIDPAIEQPLRGLVGHGRVSTQPVLVGILFLLVVSLNAWRRRFFCNVLCPLGALYGLLARFSLLRLERREGCDSCGTCARRCTYDGDPAGNYLKSECLVCLHCVEDCPREGVDVRFAWPRRTRRTPLDVGRRRLLGAAACGVVVAALPKASLAAQPGGGHRFARPPGASRERDFLTRCARCGQCVQACPTGFIQPALLEAGLEGIWTPVLNARAGYCLYECRRCTGACPTGAIQRLTLEEKKPFKMGTAVVDRDWCLTYADGIDCTVCADRCPVTPKAIRFREVETWDFRGRYVKVRQAYVVPDLCTGCGICEHFCPRGGSPGIVNTAEDEDREAVG